MIELIAYTLAAVVLFALHYFFGIWGVAAPAIIFLFVSIGHRIGTGRWL